MATIVKDFGKVILNDRLRSVKLLSVIESILSDYYNANPVYYEDMKTDPKVHYSGNTRANMLQKSSQK